MADACNLKTAVPEQGFNMFGNKKATEYWIFNGLNSQAVFFYDFLNLDVLKLKSI